MYFSDKSSSVNSASENMVEEPKPKTSFCYRITHCYDRSFITAFAFKQLNMGCLGVQMPIVVLQMLKVKYKVSPNWLSFSLMIVHLPADLSIVWGVLADTVRVKLYENAPKKSLWLILTLIEVIMLVLLASLKIESVGVLIFLLFTAGVSFHFFNSLCLGLRTI